MPHQAPRVKVCCISSLAEARLAIAAGAHALGLVSAMPSGPGVIDDSLIAAIAAIVPPGVDSFLLTSAQDAATIIDQQRRLRVATLQIVDRLDLAAYAELRRALPGIRLVQVVHVAGPDSIDEAARVAPRVDAILLDSGNQALPVKQLGGTGRVHDWSLSRAIRDRLAALDPPRPLFLAGGLNPANVADAIRRVAPYALDVCSGVRTAGRLDEAKLAAFMHAVRQAD